MGLFGLGNVLNGKAKAARSERRKGRHPNHCQLRLELLEERIALHHDHTAYATTTEVFAVNSAGQAITTAEWGQPVFIKATFINSGDPEHLPPPAGGSVKFEVKRPDRISFVHEVESREFWHCPTSDPDTRFRYCAGLWLAFPQDHWVGQYTFTAHYSGYTTELPPGSPPPPPVHPGTYQLNPSDGAGTLEIKQAATKVTLVPEWPGMPSDPVVGERVSYVATVSRLNPGSGTPSRKVEFHSLPPGSSDWSMTEQPLNQGRAGWGHNCSVEGDYVVFVHYDGDSNFKSSVSQPSTVTCRAAPPRLFGLFGLAAASTAGAATTLTVTALSAFGNPVTGYTGTVAFSSTDSQAMLPANYTFTAADNGTHTFTVTLKTAGARTVTVTDTATSSVTGQATTTVAPAAVSTLVVSGFPETLTAGTARTITVTARDAFGNIATGYRGIIRFNSTDSQATLPPNYTYTAANNGVRSFSVTLRTAGSRSITVTDTTTPSLTATVTTTVTPASSTFALSGIPAASTAGVANTFTVTVRDAFGNIVTGYRGIVRFSSTDSQATLPANYTFTAADNGVHIFTATLKTAGARTVTATDTVTSSITGRATTTVAPAAASTLTFSSLPSSVPAGARSLTVTALDAFGNIATGYRGIVRFSSNDSQATLPPNYTYTAANNGVRAFSVTLRTAGSRSITVTDTAISSLTATATTTVTPAAASIFVLSGIPAASTAGVASTFTVTVRDAYGNTVIGYRGIVRFSSTDSQATLPANYTFTAADNGVHTFTATLKTAGARTVTATDTVTPSITGRATATITPAAASTLVVSGLPATLTAGTARTITVTARDAYGNTATGYRGTVRFSSTDGQAGLPANYTFTAADNGVHTFTVTLRTAGSRSITVTDPLLPNPIGIATTTVTPAAATQFRISAPASCTAGLAFSVTVTALDAFGNIATGYRGAVRFSSTDSQATLPANYTFTAADNGVYTFSVTLRTAGSRNITVTDTVTPSRTGNVTTMVT